MSFFRPELDHPKSHVLRHRTKESWLHVWLSSLQLVVMIGALRILMLAAGMGGMEIPGFDAALREVMRMFVVVP